MEGTKVANICGVIGCICLLVGITVIVTTDLYEIKEGVKYCKEKGYDGFQHSGDRCYKYIPHPSGIGEEEIYSGKIGITNNW